MLCFGGLVGSGRVGVVYINLLMFAPRSFILSMFFVHGRLCELCGYRNMGLNYEQLELKFFSVLKFHMLSWQHLCLKCRLHPFRPCPLFPSLIFCWISHGRMIPTSLFPVAMTSGLSSGVLTATANGCAAHMGNRGNMVSNLSTDPFPLEMYHACLHRGLLLSFARAQGTQHLRGWSLSTNTRKSILTLGGSTTSGRDTRFSKWRIARAVEPAQVIYQMICQWLLTLTQWQRPRMSSMMKMMIVSNLFIRVIVAMLRRVPHENVINW